MKHNDVPIFKLVEMQVSRNRAPAVDTPNFSSTHILSYTKRKDIRSVNFKPDRKNNEKMMINSKYYCGISDDFKIDLFTHGLRYSRITKAISNIVKTL